MKKTTLCLPVLLTLMAAVCSAEDLGNFSANPYDPSSNSRRVLKQRNSVVC